MLLTVSILIEGDPKGFVAWLKTGLVRLPQCLLELLFRLVTKISLDENLELLPNSFYTFHTSLKEVYFKRIVLGEKESQVDVCSFGDIDIVDIEVSITFDKLCHWSSIKLSRQFFVKSLF